MSLPLVYVKIFGERNSGTNYVEDLIEMNFWSTVLLGSSTVPYRQMMRMTTDLEPVGRDNAIQLLQDLDHRRILESDFGWKHAVPPLSVISNAPHAAQTLFVIVTKQPHFWAQSLFKRDYARRARRQDDFSGFLRAPWVAVMRDELGTAFAANPIQLLNAKVRGYDKLSRLGVAFLHIGYEDMLHDFEGQMRRIAEHLIPRSTGFTNVVKGLKGDNAMSTDDYKKKYRMERIFETMTAADVEFIDSELDVDVMGRFGYGRLGRDSLIHVAE